MKTKFLPMILTMLMCGCAVAETAQTRMPAQETAAKISNIDRLIEYKDGLLKVEMDTCGGQVFPVVHFKPLEEVVDPSANYGIYKATITKSVELAPTATCPYVAPTHFELDLKKLWKGWSDSANGSPQSRKIFEAGGEIEISVSTFSTGINFKIPVSRQHH
jgi:hypothetical protein